MRRPECHLGIVTPSTLDQTQLLTENAFQLYIVQCIYKSNLCAFLRLSLMTKFLIPAIHLFTALGLSSGSTGSTSTDGLTGREKGVIGKELSSSVVDASVVNPGVFWRGRANVLRGNRPGNGVGGVEKR